jgi:C4-type Zn-finger protein
MALGINKEEMHDIYIEMQSGRESAQKIKKIEGILDKKDRTSRAICNQEGDYSLESNFESGKIAGRREILEMIRKEFNVESVWYQ